MRRLTSEEAELTDETEPRAVVRVRVRAGVIRVRIDDTRVRIRVVVRATEDTALGFSTCRWRDVTAEEDYDIDAFDGAKLRNCF